MRTRLTAPVVLAHGLFGFERIGLGPFTLASYFRGIPELLRSMGNRVLVTQVHPTGGIQRRARTLGEHILAAFPDEPVHIIGHSMGGLDARELLTDPAWSGRVLSVTTISTPHLGSTMADLARRTFGPVYRFLKAIGWDHEGFLDLIPDRAARWHERTRPPEGIPCFSVAGDPPEAEVCWPLQRLFALMSRREGPNDGLVSVASASAFGRPLPAWPTDHLQQMNWWTGYPRLRVPPRIAAAYASVVENMALCERAPEYAERH
jgi:triacylglycerol lipase